ncbi:protein TMED8 [Discoglossus pictus]
MSLAPAAASLVGTPSGTGDPENGEVCQKEATERGGCEEEACAPPAVDAVTSDIVSDAAEEGAALAVQEPENTEHPNTENTEHPNTDSDESKRSEPDVGDTEKPSQCPREKKKISRVPKEPAQTSLEKELDAILSLCSEESNSPDVLMIQSEHSGQVDIVKVESPQTDSEEGKGKAPPPPLAPPSTWTSVNLREFKSRMAQEKHGMLTVRRGEVMTIRVPTHPEGKRLCWEFATDDYDIGFGIYFDWTPVTSTAVTLQVSESSDEEDEEETESPWHSREGDVERGSVYRLRSRYGEIMQVFRRDSHREVQAGSHEYPGEGVYLLKLDNSYSLLRSKTLYFHVYYSS